MSQTKIQIDSQIYPNMYKYEQNTQDMYKAGPGRLGAGPGWRRIAAAWYFVYIFIYLDIFAYIWMIYVGCVFGVFLFGMVTPQGPK